MMKNKIHVRICGIEYTLLSNEAPEYVHKVAYLVDKKMSEIMRADSKLNSAMASLLTAINLADEHFKDINDTDNLRMQVAEYNRLSEEYKDKLVVAESELEEANKRIKELEAELKRCEMREVNYIGGFEDIDDGVL